MLKKIVLNVVIMLAVAVAALVGSRVVNTYLGQRAIEQVAINKLSLSDALDQARETGKPVLVEMSAIWCGSCRKFANKVLTATDVKDLVESRFLFTRVEYETDEGKAFMQRYGLRGFPTILVLDGYAAQQAILPTTYQPTEFVDMLNTYLRMAGS